jgi:5'-methylthioadenosine phosphorylase
MSPLGLIVGSALLGAEPAPAADVAVLQRHGSGDYLPPHRIDHGANLRSLARSGCEAVLAISSVGSLRAETAVGSFLCPSDFIALHLGGSAFEDERGHIVPGFDHGWRSRVIEAWGRGVEEALHEGGTYWQAIGPRFETPAEIRLIAPHAEVIGMTLASECIAACELGLDYAAVCVVDNLANGIGDEVLSGGTYEAGRSANRARLESIVPGLVAELRAGARP